MYALTNVLDNHTFPAPIQGGDRDLCCPLDPETAEVVGLLSLVGSGGGASP